VTIFRLKQVCRVQWELCFTDYAEPNVLTILYLMRALKDAEFSDRISRDGWACSHEDDVLPHIKQAVAQGFSSRYLSSPLLVISTQCTSLLRRRTFAHPNPYFDPISTAFARPFPQAHIYVIAVDHSSIGAKKGVQLAKAAANILCALPELHKKGYLASGEAAAVVYTTDTDGASDQVPPPDNEAAVLVSSQRGLSVETKVPFVEHADLIGSVCLKDEEQETICGEYELMSPFENELMSPIETTTPTLGQSSDTSDPAVQVLEDRSQKQRQPKEAESVFFGGVEAVVSAFADYVSGTSVGERVDISDGGAMARAVLDQINYARLNPQSMEVMLYTHALKQYK
jgi:hypothetical protein